KYTIAGAPSTGTSPDTHCPGFRSNDSLIPLVFTHTKPTSIPPVPTVFPPSFPPPPPFPIRPHSPPALKPNSPLPFRRQSSTPAPVPRQVTPRHGPPRLLQEVPRLRAIEQVPRRTALIPVEQPRARRLQEQPAHRAVHAPRRRPEHLPAPRPPLRSIFPAIARD